MSNEQIPRGSLEHLKKIDPAEMLLRQPLMLGYGTKGYGQPATRGFGQFVLGFFFWIFSAAAAILTFAGLANRAGNAAFITVGIYLAIVLGVCAWTSTKLRWRSFIPGVLLGAGLTCLVPVGIVAVICGNTKF